MSVNNDSDKRGRIILVSVIVTFLAFFLKISQQSDSIGALQIYLNAGVVGVVAYIGLLWAIRFQVTFRTLVYVISQSSLIVFILTLFLEMFVFRKVGRVYELLILLSVSGLMFFGTYASMLMANIFNVAAFKELPLAQVGKTTSLILTVLSIYFATFVVLESNLNSYVTIILLTVMVCALLITHIRHLEIPRNVLWKRIFTILVLVILTLIAQILVGGSPLMSAFVPTIVAYSLINIITIENLSTMQKFEYFFMTFAAFLFNFLMA